MTRNVLVFGGTGQQGSAFVRALAGQNPSADWTIHVLTRAAKSGAPLAALPGVKLVYVPDYMDYAVRAFEATGLGKGEIYGVFMMQGYVTEAVEMHQGIAIADAAKQWAVEHFIYSSVSHDDDNSKDLDDSFDGKRRIEAHIQSIGLTYTFLHPTDFMDNWLKDRPYMLRTYRTVLLRHTFGSAPENQLPMVSTRDIGRAGALALADRERFKGRALKLVGDRLTAPQIEGTYLEVMGEPVYEVNSILASVSKMASKVLRQLSHIYATGREKGTPEQTREFLPDVEDFRTFLARVKESSK